MTTPAPTPYTATPEYHVRVSMPNPGGFHAGPSGDADYDEAYHKALAAAVPIGFEPIAPRRNEKWPVDGQGFTWVPLRCANDTRAIAVAMQRAERAEKELERIRAAVRLPADDFPADALER